MLFDDTTAIDGHDITIGEGFADEAERLGIVIGLIVGGTEHSPIDDQEIGIRRRES